MTLAWKSPFIAGKKLVLLALCDNANDQGECFPSVSMLAEKCSMSERSVFNHIADLEKDGALQRNNRTGRSTIYRIDPCKFCIPADSAPLQRLHPTPATVAPITISNHQIEPSSNQKKKAQAPVFLLPDWIDQTNWDAWHSCEKRKKATPEQKQLAVSKLAKWRDAGEDFAAALENAAVGGWQGLFLPDKKDARAKPVASSKHSGFSKLNYREGVEEDGTFV